MKQMDACLPVEHSCTSLGHNRTPWHGVGRAHAARDPTTRSTFASGFPAFRPILASSPYHCCFCFCCLLVVIVDTVVCTIRVAQTAADLGNLGWHTKQRVLLGLLAEVSATAAAVLLLLCCLLCWCAAIIVCVLYAGIRYEYEL